MTTFGCPYNFSTYKLLDKYFIRLIIIGTAGHERFRKINEYLYKKADGIILSYDITNKYSFESCKYYFCKKIKELCKPNIKTILIGNKNDLEDERKISFKEGKDFLCQMDIYLWKHLV